MRRVALIVVLACFWVTIGWGCSGETDTTGGSSSSGTGAGGTSYDGGLNDGSSDAPDDVGTLLDGGQSPVYLGLTANGVGLDGGAPTTAEIALAELTSLAAGVRAVVVDVPWAELDPNDLSVLSARVDTYMERDQKVVLALLVVDGNVGYRPPALDGLAWDDPAVQAELNTALDAIVMTLGDKLEALVLGRRTDVYLASHGSEEDPLRLLLTFALTHVKVEAPDLSRAVGLSFLGLELPSSAATLASLGSCLAVTYFPGLGEAPLPADTSPAKDLDEMIELAANRPVVIQALGLATAPSLGGSEAAQLQFYQAFFTALEPRRGAFPVVNVHQLHDWVGAACDGYALAQGYTPGDVFADYLCTTGLRVDPDTAKEGWFGFLEASARFAEP